MPERELTRAVFDDNPIPMWRCDTASRRIVAVNEAAVRTYGYSRDELLTMTVASLEAPPVLGEVASKVVRHQRKNGTPLFVELNSHKLDDSEQLVIVVDVTDRETARAALRTSEAKLSQAHKMDAIGRLASGVAHDFNNVLMVVQASAYILEETVQPESGEAVEVAEILRAVDRATGLTRQLLAMSRQSVVAPKLVKVCELVQKLVPALGRLLGPGIEIDVIGAGMPPVKADAGQLEQVVMNLAVNARDAMEGHGRLTLETTLETLDAEQGALYGLKPGPYVKLAVADTGPGMDREMQKRIFDPFFTTKAPGKGTGLGLSIVHGILAQAGGGVDVYSEKGYGTSFHVRLPVAEDGASEITQKLPVVTRRLRPATVLFVDSLAELRRVMARALESMGCTVIEAATAAEARDACVRHDGPIHVAVIDATLPDGNGHELARMLSELRPELRALLMSGFPAGALSRAGDVAVALLAKPFTPTQLRDVIAELVAEAAAPVRVSEPRMQSRVLVVDDDPTLRKMLVRMLKRAGYEVGDADSGRMALAMLGKERFEVIVSDIHMADGDGLELLRSVRRVDLDVPVVLMSGKPDVATAAKALEYGAFRYLTKPLENEEMERVVRQAARAHALARLRREAVRVGGGHTGASDRAGLEVRFEQALDALWMAFQPIVEASTGARFGMEALMRSREPSMSGPGQLLDAATTLERLPALGRRTRHLAGTAMADRGEVLFMNLHPTDLMDANLVDPEAPLTKIAPRVILEVTERESLVPSAQLIERLELLRRMGFRIAVDDIGAGYSGLTSFADLTPEIVKIDMSLVRNIHVSVVKQRTVAALCTLCHDMGARVVGEGVETVAEQACLVELGCDLLQGYLLGRPGNLPPAGG